ncbi:hypothetical protein T492DRAFT_116247 [Pavlovales sp. CCMP2436]|nr:hypothetical protein T492DRAFT_116247 [Pavlovales sp. CCMP2436]
MVLDGVTVLLPKAYDPSELRTDITGKVEAMKMIMPLKSTEEGMLTQTKSGGSIIQQGDLLATLELADPSKVQKITQFEGSLSLPSAQMWVPEGGEVLFCLCVLCVVCV